MSEAVNRLCTRISDLHLVLSCIREEIGDVHRATQIGHRDAVRYNPTTNKTWISVIVPIFRAPFPDVPNDYASAEFPDRNAGFSRIGPPLLVWLE